MGYSERAVLWRSLVDGSLDRCVLRETAGGHELEGEIHTLDDGNPVRVAYKVTCDKRWETRAVVVSWQEGPRVRELHLEAGEGHEWKSSGQELAEVRGCIDVDLGLTPATNTLPIRRLSLQVGESAEVTAAWVLFPELKVEPLQQVYTRLDSNRYRYESGQGVYTVEIEVDDLGLVTWYEGGWERVMSAGNL